jgi:hypothetical protein
MKSMEMRFSRSVCGQLAFSAFLAVCLTLAAYAPPSAAGIDTAALWLKDRLTDDGAYRSVADLATPDQGTAEAVRTLGEIQPLDPASLTLSLNFLQTESRDNVEFLARRIIAAASNSQDASGLVVTLLAHQNADGGFAGRNGFDSSILETAFALEALAAVDSAPGKEVAGAVSYLAARQLDNGGWSDGPNGGSTYLTSSVVRSLVPYAAEFPAASGALTAAQNFLLARRGDSGLWDDELQSAEALVALAGSLSDVQVLGASIDALAARQAPDGSWSEDVYTTAVAARALRLYAGRTGGATGSAGLISGRVVQSGSGAPIAGATVAISELGGFRVTTNADGAFLLQGVAAGHYTLVAQRSGFGTASKAVQLPKNSTVNVGEFVLVALPDQGLMTGRVFDQKSGVGLAGASVTLSGPSPQSLPTGAAGGFTSSGLLPGRYQVQIGRDGYHPVSLTVDVLAGQQYVVNQGLVSTASALDDGPVDLTGRVVHAKTQVPVVGATVSLSNGATAISDASGDFALPGVARGEYTLQIAASGFQNAQYVLGIPAGASGALGELPIHPADQAEPATSITLYGRVLDALSQDGLGGASVELVGAGRTAAADADGNFVLDGIGSTTFQLQLSAPGYQPAGYQVTASGFGSISQTFALSPQSDDSLTSSALAGTVVDAATGAPIAGARVAIDALGLTATTDAAGAYTLPGVSSLQFRLGVSASGYLPRDYDVELQAHGNYRLDPKLDVEQGQAFRVLEVAAEQASLEAGDTALFHARISNLLMEPQQVLVLGQVMGASGVIVGELSAYAEGTTQPTSDFTFVGEETKSITLAWSVGQAQPGTYTVVVRAVQPGSITRSNPAGTVLADNRTFASVGNTARIAGALAVEPPQVQANRDVPVALYALVRNVGNVDISGADFELSVLHPDSGDVLHSTRAPLPFLAVNEHAKLDFGAWVPTAAGDLPVRVLPLAGAAAGRIDGVIYVGDVGSGSFTVDKSVVPEGDQTVAAAVTLRGVDTKTGGATDPLYALVRNAVERGGTYTADQSLRWHRSNRCLGCHTQTQGHLGLASSLDKATIERTATVFLHNTLTSSVQSDGGIRISHPSLTRTQTALAMWSLTAWEDKAQVFRAQYHAARHMHQRRTVSGSNIYWSPDHASGWWYSLDATTSIVVQGMADLLKGADTVDLGAVMDYGFQATWSGLGASARDLAVADGAAYVLGYGGVLWRVDLADGTVTTVASGIGSSTRGLAVDAAGNIFIASESGTVFRIAIDGARTTVATGLGQLGDVEIGPDGALYLPVRNPARILRLVPGAPAEIFASGGLLNGPIDLAFDAAGDLLIANYGGFNILKRGGDGAMSVVGDGLGHRPIYLEAGADGAVYFSGERAGDGTSERAISLLRPDGTIERLASSRWLEGIAMVDGLLLAVDDNNRRLMELKSAPIDASLLDHVRQDIEGATRFLLARHKDNSSDNIIQAQRMLGLAAAREILPAGQLLTDAEAAIQYLDALLRARQRADGGWGRYTTSGTDSLVTAMVGLALDTQNPSPKDPMVRKTIEVLLARQQSDGSWTTGVLGTRLAGTGFVMAYMPKALERLGGIDIDLKIDFGTNVAMREPSVPPTEQAAGEDGGTSYTWRLLGVTGHERELTFALDLQDMQLGETRPVARAATITFSNSFTGEPITAELDIPSVQAASELGLTVVLDKAVYGPNENVSIEPTVGNTGPAVADGSVKLTVRTVDGQAVDELPLLMHGPLGQGDSTTMRSAWNTTSRSAGSYQVHGVLLDPHGRVLDEATVPFAIATSTAVLTSSITTDKPVYGAWDTVELQGRLRNLSPNQLTDTTIAEITVRAPAGEVVHSYRTNVGGLAPGGTAAVPSSLKLDDAASGAYSVVLKAIHPISRAVLHSSSTTFTVERQVVQAVAGMVRVNKTQVYRGEPNICRYTTSNFGAQAIDGLKLTYKLASLDTGEVIGADVETIGLGGVSAHTRVSDINTRSLALGGYVCTLEAEIAGLTKRLGSAGFQVLKPPIDVDGELSLGSRGRLLVLLDPAGAKPSDPHGPPGEPDLLAQREFLEALLADAGWSYTIVTSGEDFARELRTGGYLVYALFHEHVKIAEAVQAELVDAVEQGAGLLYAGYHDQRNGRIEPALGIKVHGKLPRIGGLRLTESLLHPAADAAFELDVKPLKADVEGGQALGHYLPLGKKGSELAMADHVYGGGRSVYMGFDILLEATLQGRESLLATLILRGLDHVHPPQITPTGGSVLPLVITLTNRGIASQGEVLLSLPAGAVVIDPGAGEIQLDGRVRWSFSLAEDEAKTLPLWVKMPAQSGSALLQGVIRVNESGELIDHGGFQWELFLQPPR